MNLLCKIRNICLLYFLFVLLPAYSYQRSEVNDWPKLDGNANRIECINALSLAKASFKSNQFDVYNFAFGSPRNISLNDQSVFATIERKDQTTSEDIPLHWQRQPDHGLRWVIKEENYGWRGNQYAVYVINEEITSDKFIANPGSPIIGETWNAPIIMRTQTTNKLWAIDVGQPFVPLSDWAIFAIDNNQPTQLCKIHFRPPVVSVIELLPLPVQKLEKLLDGTMGDRSNEGTLNSTAGLRLKVAKTWVNVALRPWALSCAEKANFCNTEKNETDLELKKWSHKSADFKKLYDQIYREYPKAEKALAKYYEDVFHVDSTKAKLMANYALNAAFIAHFSF